MRKTYTLNINQFIGEENKKKEKLEQNKLLQIIDDEERILLVANPGVGKTTFASELMQIQKTNGNRFVYATFLTAIPKQLNDDFDFDLVCSSSEKTWTDRISSTDKDDDLLSDTELVVGTTLHQLTRFAGQLKKDDIIVLDEAHQLVQLSHQSRIQALREELLSAEAKLLLMSGTPYLEDADRLNLSIVNVVEANPRIDKLIYLPVTDQMKEETNLYDFAISILHWYFTQDDVVDEYGIMRLKIDHKKVLIYNNSSKDKNEILVNRLYENYDFRFDDINADKKHTAGYKYLIDHQKIRGEANGIVTTSVIKEGINIRNQDIDVIIVLGHLTLKDEKQIAKRIRGNKPINIFRIYEQVEKEKVEEIEFEIDLVNFLSNSFTDRPDRLQKQLKRLAECGELLKSTGILDANVKSINMVKVQDILEQLEAKKASLQDFISRQMYNDLEAVDGYEFLKDEHNLFIADLSKLGDNTAQLKVDADDLRKQNAEELNELMLMLFGDSNHFDVVIKLLKGDLISYSNTGKLLREIKSKKIYAITADNYVTDYFPEDKFDDMDDEEKEELLIETVITFSTKFRKEMLAVIKILYFLTEHADDITDVLRVLNKKIERSKLEFTAKRFLLSAKLEEIRKKTSRYKTLTHTQLRFLAVLREPVDRIRYQVLKEIESYIEKYSVIQMTHLKGIVNKKFGADQYMKRLGIDTQVGLKLFVYAMGKITEKPSWKVSKNNTQYFNKLWKDSGRKGLPVARSSLSVLELETCTPSELIDHYRDDL